MPTSEARIIANRQNALRSTGPKTEEGKARSRANGLKHGLSGQGVVLAEADVSAVERRTADLLSELAPKSTVGLAMVGQLATLSVRLERASRHEDQATASRVRHASTDFDHDRIDRAEELFDTLADHPRRHLRLLRRSPEGVERLIEAWGDLRDLLTRSNRPNWTASTAETLAHLLGKRFDQFEGSNLDALGRAIRGESVEIDALACASLGEEGRRSWAIARLIERIDAEIAGLEAHYESLDFEAIELDRSGAADLALFDPSREANLARRYEAESRRGFFRALKEFRQAEAEAAARPAPQPVRPPEPATIDEPLASSCAGGSRTAREPEPTASEWPDFPISSGDSAARGLDGRVIAVGRAMVGAR